MKSEKEKLKSTVSLLVSQFGFDGLLEAMLDDAARIENEYEIRGAFVNVERTQRLYDIIFRAAKEMKKERASPIRNKFKEQKKMRKAVEILRNNDGSYSIWLYGRETFTGTYEECQAEITGNAIYW